MALSLSAPALLLYRLGEKAGIAEFSASSFQSFLVRSVRGRAAAPRAKVKRVAMLGVSSLGPPAIKVAPRDSERGAENNFGARKKLALTP